MKLFFKEKEYLHMTKIKNLFVTSIVFFSTFRDNDASLEIVCLIYGSRFTKKKFEFTAELEMLFDPMLRRQDPANP